jgi:hypothetical protein
MSTCTFRT